MKDRKAREGLLKVTKELDILEKRLKEDLYTYDISSLMNPFSLLAADKKPKVDVLLAKIELMDEILRAVISHLGIVFDTKKATPKRLVAKKAERAKGKK